MAGKSELRYSERRDNSSKSGELLHRFLLNICGREEESSESPLELCGKLGTSTTIDGTIRLVNGNLPNQGRVEVMHQGQWGTVCEAGFGNKTVDVICRQLGYNRGGISRTGAKYGEGTGPVWPSDIKCNGDEARLVSFRHRPWGLNNCGHYEDIGVICNNEQNDMDIRLVKLDGTPNDSSGRLEIYHNGEWGTVCNDDINNQVAIVVCRQLGHT
ncbi:scavenger receptor cysteine-rich domain superfamily protein-like [Saccoglossus kowalevskii]